MYSPASSSKSSAKTAVDDTRQDLAFQDFRPENSTHIQLQAAADQSSSVRESAQLQAAADQFSARKAPKTQSGGLPARLKSGVESLSGHSMDDVQVHYNSAKPAQLQAHAFAQGNQIHLAPGQAHHLPHEAWHVVQQKQGRVQPTRQLKAKIAINDDESLEREADVMGSRALSAQGKSTETSETQTNTENPFQLVKVNLHWPDLEKEDQTIETEDISKDMLEVITEDEDLSLASSARIIQAIKEGKFKAGENKLASAIKTATARLNRFTSEQEEDHERIEEMAELLPNIRRYILQGQDKGDTLAEAKIGWKKVEIYQAFWKDSTSDEQRIDTLIHEWTHVVFNSQDYAYKWNRMFKYLTEEEHGKNPDSIVTLVNEATDNQSLERPPETVGSEEISASAIRVADKAFALMGEILFHANIPTDETLAPKVEAAVVADESIQEEHREGYVARILPGIRTLSLWAPSFRNKKISLVKGDAWAIASSQAGLAITLPDAEKGVEAILAGPPEKLFTWLSYQLVKNVKVAKQMAKIIISGFHTNRGAAIGHAQGMYSKTLLDLDTDNI